MKKNLFLFTISMMCLLVNAQNVELSNSLLSEFNTQKNNVELKSSSLMGHHDHLWMTPFLKKVIDNWDVLTQEAQDVFEVYTTAPTFSGDELIYERGKFQLHYCVNSTVDAENVAVTDANNDGVPDYVESMGQAFATVQDKYHNQIGLIPPVYTNGFYPIYINGAEAGEGTYGYVAADPDNIVGDNPNSPDVVELDAASSFMVMRNNYEGFADPDKAYKVTAAHEYMHAIQYGCDWDIETWFSEACATWGEEYVFPGYDDNFQYLSAVLSSPDIALNVADSEGEDYEGHWYGAFLFTQYLVEQTSGTIIGQLYTELIGDLSDESMTVDAIDKVVNANWTETFSSFDAVFAAYALSNTILSQDEMFFPYIYKRADAYYTYVYNDAYSSFYEEATFSYEGSAIDFDSRRDGNSRLMRLSSDPFSLTSTGNFNVSLEVDADTEIDLVLVKFSDGKAVLVFSDDDYNISVADNSEWSQYYLAVIRWDSDVTDTASVDYHIVISELYTGVEDALVSGFQIRPNPALDYIVINHPELISRVQILDVSGRDMLISGVNSLGRIDIAALPSGSYFVKVAYGEQQVVIEKLIVK